MKEEVKRLDLGGMHQGPRGWGMDPLRIAGAGSQDTGSLHLVSIRSGASRGNHFHANATEWILVFGGSGMLVWKSPVDGNVRKMIVNAESPAFFQVPPWVEHAVVNTSEGDIYALVFYDHPAPETVPGTCTLGNGKGGKP
jgi:oxalate decarboxylase/phosphoglucose isomerase-like protein (cupin superfamily)